jgi:hypothetical protein
MSNEIILLQILYRHLILLFFTYESENSLIYPMWAIFLSMTQKSQKKKKKKKNFYIAIWHLVFFTLIHFIYISN